MNKKIWVFKQMLPLTYRSHYETSDKKKMFSVWRMWFGKVFDHESFEIKQ